VQYFCFTENTHTVKEISYGFFFVIIAMVMSIALDQRIIMRIFLALSILLLGACATNQGISLYTVDENELSSKLKQQLPKLNREVRVMGFTMEFGVNDLGVDIGPEKRDVIVLDFDAAAKLNAIVTTYSLSIGIQVEGTPYYDSAQKAVFVKDVKLLDSNIEAPGYSGSLSVIDGQVLKIINDFLAVNPVYKLDMNNSRVKWMANLPVNMQIADGAIRLVPQL
jgi:hypothetical protein